MAPEPRPIERISRIKIEGFRSIRSADIELGDLTVLIGANGSGKSNLLGFLEMLQYIATGKLALYVRNRRGANRILHFGSEKTPQLRGELSFQSNGKFRYVFVLEAVASDGLAFESEALLGETEEFIVRHGPVRLDDIPHGGYLESSELASAHFGASESVRALLSNLFTNLGIFHFHNTSNLAPIRSLQELTEDRRLLPNGGNLAVILLVVSKRFPGHYARIIDEMRGVMPGFHDFVLEPSLARDERQVELRWISKYSTAVLGPDQMSDGSLRAAALVTLLLQPQELMPSVIVIDEPELGLHPASVSQIAGLVVEASVQRQVIVSTQSPQFLAQFEPEQVIVIENEDGESTFRRLESDVLASWLEEFNHDLGLLFEMNVTGGAPRWSN
jgi:predicted ATPase